MKLVRAPGARVPDGSLLERLVAAGVRLPSQSSLDAAAPAPATASEADRGAAEGTSTAQHAQLADAGGAAGRHSSAATCAGEHHVVVQQQGPAPGAVPIEEGAPVTSFLREHLRAAACESIDSHRGLSIDGRNLTAPGGAARMRGLQVQELTAPAECSMSTSRPDTGRLGSSADLSQANIATGDGAHAPAAPSSIAAGALVQAALNAMAAAQPGKRPPEVLPVNIWPTTPQAAALVVQVGPLARSKAKARNSASAETFCRHLKGALIRILHLSCMEGSRRLYWACRQPCAH